MIDAIHLLKPRTVDLPGHGIVLRNARGRGFHDGVGLIVFHEQADDAALGNIGANLRLQPQIALLLRHFPVHARPVEGLQRHNAVLHVRVGQGRRVHRQVASLAVAHHPQGPVGALRRLRQIVHGGLLGRHAHLVGHIEVLPPADDRVVRAPEGHAHGSVRQVDAHGGKLNLLLRVADGDEVMHPAVPEAHAFGHRPEGPAAVFKAAAGLAVVLEQADPLRLGEGPALRVLDAVEVQIAHGGHQHAVHGTPGRHGEGKFSPPGQIVNHVRHGQTIPSVDFFISSHSSRVMRHFLGLLPSLAATMPRSSISSVRRPARA